MAKVDYLLTGMMVLEFFLCSIVRKLLLADNENSKEHTPLCCLPVMKYTAIDIHNYTTTLTQLFVFGKGAF